MSVLLIALDPCSQVLLCRQGPDQVQTHWMMVATSSAQHEHPHREATAQGPSPEDAEQ